MRQRNKGEERARRRAWYEKNKEKKKAASKRWRQENADKERARHKRRYADNRDEIRAYARAWYQANAPARRAKHKQWRENNPDKVCAHAAARRARKAAAAIDDPQELLDLERELRESPCAACGAEERVEVDHIVPLALGGAHAGDNLQALCRRCNARKGTRSMEDFLASA